MDPLAGSQWSDRVGFAPDPDVRFREHDRPQPGILSRGTMPVIYEAAFRHEG